MKCKETLMLPSFDFLSLILLIKVGQRCSHFGRTEEAVAFIFLQNSVYYLLDRGHALLIFHHRCFLTPLSYLSYFLRPFPLSLLAATDFLFGYTKLVFWPMLEIPMAETFCYHLISLQKTYRDSVVPPTIPIFIHSF